MKKEEKRAELKKLPDGELEVMQAVWACKGAVTRKKIEDVLFEDHKMAATTLLTFLSRLADKGYIEVKKDEREYRYKAIVSRREYLADQSRRFVGKLCGGSMPTFAAALCDSGLSKEEIKELRKLLKEKGE